MFSAAERAGKEDVDSSILDSEISQKTKLEEIVELLLVGGYFRARISSLSAFDKVIGGMAWAVTASNEEVELDFIENAQIGHKIKLSENLVRALERMKCPYPLKPHQIQGLDYENLYPIIQWLIKKVIEVREETGDLVRAYSETLFERKDTLPVDVSFYNLRKKNEIFIEDTIEKYRPARKFKRNKGSKRADEESKITNTLLEFAVYSAALTVTEDEEEEAEQQRKLRHLMKRLVVVDDEGGEVSRDALDNLVDLQSQQIKMAADAYEETYKAHGLGQENEGLGAEGTHKRTVKKLKKQIAHNNTTLEELRVEASEYAETEEKGQRVVKKKEAYKQRIIDECDKLDALETPENAHVLAELKSLVQLNEDLKAQEKKFKEDCRQQREELIQLIEQMKSEGVDSEEVKRLEKVAATFDKDQEKLQKLRALRAKKTKQVTALIRAVDAVPSRAELAQYQARFAELYEQVDAKLVETRKHYTTYNNLTEQQQYLLKEVKMLDSIHENFHIGMKNKSSQEKFIQSMTDIVQGFEGMLRKAEAQLSEEKASRDRYTASYTELVEQERLYYKTVKDFQKECDLNESLQKEATALSG
eukprot:GCRY01002212.1.p1 GENE.GCRY01002212.1~~GCRY01002212.1.p1  ORF type:complete len:589 (-),score=151.86 GCRY01002212.1:57-1823(-)